MKIKPNILFILTDQQTRDAMGAYGNSFVHTPHMDGIAGDGVRFEKSYCVSPVCSPARAGLFTSRMPHEVGVNLCDQPIAPSTCGMGDVFRNAGYETAWAGKWHLPDCYPQDTRTIPGFNYLPVEMPPQWYLGTGIDPLVTDAAVRFIEKPHNRPFLLTVSLHNPHDICYWIMDREKQVLPHYETGRQLPPLPPNFAIDPHEPEFIRLCRQRADYGPELRWTRDWDSEQWQKYLYVYYRLIDDVDSQIGRLLGTLRTSGLDQDTLVVLTSDHGEGVAAHRWVAKLMLYEEPVTVPLLMNWKGRISAATTDTDHLVCGLDVLPTLCDYADISPPQGIRGMSLRPIIENPGLPGRDSVVAELQPDPKKMDMKGRMLRTRRYKYIAFSEGHDPEMLFDMEADPGESQNLACHRMHQNKLNEHRGLLAQWIRETHDDFRQGGACSMPV